MTAAVFISVFFSVVFYTLVQCDNYHIKSSLDQACPSDNESCLTLSDFVSNFTSTNYTESDLTLIFHSGNHTLDSDLSFHNISSLTMAKKSSTLTSNNETEIIIVCNTYAHFEFESLKVVRIIRLKFVGCSRNKAKSVSQLIVEDSSFIGRHKNYGTALELYNVSARIANSSFSNNIGHLLMPMPYCRSQDSFRLSLSPTLIQVTSSGAIFSKRSQVRIDQTKFEENRAQIGAAIFSMSQSRVIITNSTFIRNKTPLNESCSGGAFLSDSSSSFTISGSYFERNTGGAVYIRDSYYSTPSVTDYRIISIINTQFKNNMATWSGAVSVLSLFENIILSITNSRFLHNRANIDVIQAWGGAISVYSDLTEVNVTITDSQFMYNRARAGGAIYMYSSSPAAHNIITIIDSKFIENNAQVGGAMYIFITTESQSKGNIEIAGTKLLNNSAYHGGGAVYILSDVLSTMTILEINKCNFTWNRARIGGVIHMQSLNSITLTVLATEFNNNIAYFDGGVFYLANSHSKISQSEFNHNTAGRFGGVARILSHFTQEIETFISDSHFICNKANDTGGAIYSVIASINTRSTSFVNNTALAGGVVGSHCYQSGYLLFRNVLIENNMAENEGGVFVAHDCFADIYDSVLTNNHADNNGGSMLLNGGQTLIKNSTLSQNTAGNDGGVVMSYRNEISIEDCTFTDNEAVNEGGVMWNDQCYTTIHKTSFETNTANAGGAIYADQGQLEFDDTMFTNNKASAGAALWAKKSNAIRGHSVTFTHNSANFGVIFFLKCTTSLRNIDFANNHGSLVAQYSILHINGYSKMNNNSQVSRSKAFKRLHEGGALTAFQSEIHFFGMSKLGNNSAERGGTLNMIESKLHIHGDTILSNNRAIESGGGIHLDHSEMICSSEAVIILHHNTASEKGGGVMATRSSILVEVDNSKCTLTFDGNQAKMGGGLCFEMDSKLVILKSSTNSTHDSIVTFTHNSADLGGAVYVSDDGMCSLTTVNQCPLQVLAMYGPMPAEFDSRCQSTINFFNNTAEVSGESLFGGLLDRCTVSTFAEPNINNLNIDYSFSNGTEVTDGHEYLEMISNVEDRHISSHPTRVCFCREGQGTPDCSYQPEPIHINKDQQQKISISLSVVDQIDHPLKEATIYSHFGSGNFLCQNHVQSIDGKCTKIEFSVESSNDTEELFLSVGDGPCENTPQSQARVIIEYVCIQCPVGFEEDTTSIKGCHCVCDSQLYPHFTNCTGGALIRDKNVWIDSINSNENSSAHRYLIHPYCPNSYCHPSQALIKVNLNQPNGADSQCTNNRSGLLCGRCQTGFSLSLGSSRCITCPKLWPVTLAGIILGAAIGGIALVVLLLSFKLTVADGTLNGIIFYANIVGANVSIFLPLSTPNFNAVVISWMNLEIVFDVCFFEGMDMFWKTLIQLAFPVYLIVLVALVIFVSERSRRLAQLIGNRNPVATLATLILLSYSKLLNNVIASMSSAVLKYPNGTSEIVWLTDASVGYLKGKHVALFSTSLIILTAGIAYTVVLLCWQWFLRYQHWKVFSWTKHQKLCHFIEPYQAPYTAKHRYWTGLLLLARVLLHVVSALNVNGDPQVTLLAITVTVSILLLIKGILATKIYTKWPVDVLETIMYFNIITIAALSSYYHDTGKNQAAITSISVTITLILFVSVIVFHVYKYSCLHSTIDKCLTSIYDKIKVMVLKKEPKRPVDQEFNDLSQFKNTIQLSVAATKKSETTHTIVEMRTVN